MNIRKYPKILTLGALPLILASCGGNVSSSVLSSSNDSLAVTDMLGRSVSLVPSSISKVVCIGAGALRLYSYVGDMSKLSGVETVEKGFLIAPRPYQMANDELFKSLPSCGKGGPTGSPDAEAILSCHPDLVISLYTNDAASMDLLSSQIGKPVVTLSYGVKEAFDEAVSSSITLLGKVLNVEDRANELVSYIKGIKDELASLGSTVKEEEKKTVYLGCQSNYGTKGIESSSANYSLFEASGIKNVLDVNGFKGYQKAVDLEKLKKMDPEKIILDAGGLPKLKEQFSDANKKAIVTSLSAVKNGEVYLQLPYNAYYTNLETAYCDAYYDAKVVFPNAFKGIDVAAKSTEIMKTFLKSDLMPQLEEVTYGGFQQVNDLEAFLNDRVA